MKKKIDIPANPSAQDLRLARDAAKMTRPEASQMIFSNAESIRTIQNWETGSRQVPRGVFVLFLLMTNQITVGEARRQARLLK